MSKHTPGPWVIAEEDGQQWSINAPNGDPTLGYSAWHGLAVVYGCDDMEGDGRAVGLANARLIAAAPDMLKALRRAALALAFASESSPAMQDDYKAVIAAIAKATGETNDHP